MNESGMNLITDNYCFSNFTGYMSGLEFTIIFILVILFMMCICDLGTSVVFKNKYDMNINEEPN
jgi:hypothetical protein